MPGFARACDSRGEGNPQQALPKVRCVTKGSAAKVAIDVSHRFTGLNSLP